MHALRVKEGPSAQPLNTTRIAAESELLRRIHELVANLNPLGAFSSDRSAKGSEQLATIKLGIGENLLHCHL